MTTSIVSGNFVRETSVKRRNKIVQEITRNVANVFSFYAILAIKKWFFNALTFARSLGRCWKPRPSASVFNTSHGTWRMTKHQYIQMGSRRKSIDFFKSVSQTIIHISTTNLWSERIWQTSIMKYLVSINTVKSNECKLFQQKWQEIDMKLWYVCIYFVSAGEEVEEDIQCII